MSEHGTEYGTECDPRTGEELARVHYLPAHRDGTDTTTAGPVVEGELVSEEEYAHLTSQKAQAIARYQGYRRDVVTVYRV